MCHLDKYKIEIVQPRILGDNNDDREYLYTLHKIKLVNLFLVHF